MTVDQFLLSYKSNNNKEEYVRQRIVKKYISYGEKVAICSSIVSNTMYEKVGDISVFKQDTPAREMFFRLMLVDSYTDIDINIKESPLEDFDKLDEKGLIDEIIGNIPETEFMKMNGILSWIIEDEMINNRDIVSYIDSKYQALTIAGNSLLDVLEDIKGEDYGENN